MHWRSAIVVSLVFFFVVGGAWGISLFLRGYRLDWQRKIWRSTGILAATSHPDGASVFINGKLTTATNDSLNLPPGKYQVRIEKDGFLPWEKQLIIKKEVVSQTNAILFRSAPELRPLTDLGASFPTLSPSGTRLVFLVANAKNKQRNGVWVLELTGGLRLTQPRRQISGALPLEKDEKVEFWWSPTEEEVLVVGQKSGVWLLSTTNFTPATELKDVSLQKELILNSWQEIKANQQAEILRRFPEPFVKIATQSAKIIAFSPNEEKVLYQAKKEAVVPENLLPHPPARSSQPEQRQLVENRFYVYDRREDTNFELNLKLAFNQHPPIHWLTNTHLVFIEDNQIKVIESDNTNKQTVYSGPFVNSFVFPTPDGKSLLVLASLQPEAQPDLYQVTIR